jgi:hypothetical protein
MVVLGVAATNVAATCSVPPHTADVQYMVLDSFHCFAVRESFSLSTQIHVKFTFLAKLCYYNFTRIITMCRRSTAPHLLPPLEDDYSPDLDPNHNLEEVSPFFFASLICLYFVETADSK